MILNSGVCIKLSVHLKTANGSQLPAGTRAIVKGVARDALPPIYCCETLQDDVYEVEEFYCCDNHFSTVDV